MTTATRFAIRIAIGVLIPLLFLDETTGLARDMTHSSSLTTNKTVCPTSCKEIYQSDAESKTGEYTLYDAVTGEAYNTTCIMGTFKYCNKEAGLTQIFTFENGNKCPKGFVQTSSKDSCIRARNKYGGCVSIPVAGHGILYHKVCVTVYGYQVGSPDGITGTDRYHWVEGPYVDGVSITHGRPRQHIWTFMASSSEKKPTCPCATGSTVKVPDFIGNNYFCESGNPEETAIPGKIYKEDVIWDMEQCEGVEGPCCKSTHRYAYVELPDYTTDDLEIRICSDEDTAEEDFALSMAAISVY